MSSALSAASSSRRDDASLLERGHELASLAGLGTAARDGEGRIGLIEGPAGIGKTRLLAEGRRCAEEEGFQVLAARGSELERELPFGVVRQLFEPVLIDPGAHANLLSGAAAPAKPVFAPPRDTAGLSEGGDASFAALHGLYWLSVNLTAQRPLLLAIAVTAPKTAEEPRRLGGTPGLFNAGACRAWLARAGADRRRPRGQVDRRTGSPPE